ncbi:MAG: hypothetical protein KGJ23_10440 [Euryarchaeota archaeon]|nr:hypothetical protein [Euryarchaeota archaeon]MDE1837023.1 hypothetical protein [Euryarchaeota archaeon]MDE1879873.1 hypothetical protein [Euryarchaeota archaeon]MDE2045681.1 hypothetical protein [Thermoplasmata archaeon]
MNAVLANARWELLRLLRSRRIFLLVIPVIAGPIGSALAFFYFGKMEPNGAVLTHGTALMLGLFVTGGLAGMVMLDLSALSAGEDLARRSHVIAFALPQSRSSVLLGRLLVVFGATLGVFSVGALGVWPIAGAIVPALPSDPHPLYDATHLFLAMLSLLFFLGAVTLNASIITKSSSEALVAGVLAGVVTAAAAFYFTYLHQISLLFPEVLLVVGAVALGWSFLRFERLES